MDESGRARKINARTVMHMLYSIYIYIYMYVYATFLVQTKNVYATFPGNSELNSPLDLLLASQSKLVLIEVSNY